MLANRICNDEQLMIDAVQEGFIGLIKANNKFDEKNGAKFITFAYYCVRNEILKFMKKEKKNINNLVTFENRVLDSMVCTKVEDKNFHNRYELDLTEKEFKILEMATVYNYSNLEMCKKLNMKKCDLLDSLKKLKKKMHA